MSAAKKLTPDKSGKAVTAGFEQALKIRGAEDRTTRHEVTSYTWWDKHDCQSSSADMVFETKRMALLYICKRNCESLIQWQESVGKTWDACFTESGAYSLTPSGPFEVKAMCELSDDALQEYADTLCNAFARFKAKSGTTFRYAPKDSHECDEEALLKILKRDRPTKEEMAHSKRQALLLSDIAGFD